mgnify:FL=1|tara:strand:+ start:39 stop:1190 length:1152 start_codon:yes stop_codon:yes gene_type:complete
MAQGTTTIESVWAAKGNLPDNAIVATADGKYPALDGSLITGIASAGDMTAAVYDPTTIQADAFARVNHTGTQTASTISDFDTEVSNNTDVATNNAKVTNANHTGDVTGGTVLTISTDAVDIPMLSATGAASATTFLRGDNTWAAAGGASSATETTEGIAELATLAEAVGGTDDARIITPLKSLAASLYGSMNLLNWTAVTQTNGAFSLYPDSFLLDAAATNAIVSCEWTPAAGGQYPWGASYSFSRPGAFSILLKEQFMATADDVLYVTFGKARSVSGGSEGAPVAQAVGFKIQNDTIYGVTHDGTTLTETTNMGAANENEILCTWDGAGNVTWIVDGTVYQSALGPFGDSALIATFWADLVVGASGSANSRAFFYSPIFKLL